MTTYKVECRRRLSYSRKLSLTADTLKEAKTIASQTRAAGTFDLCTTSLAL